jgi:UDP-hydrolysing UDP-N-acetyl-D-glucosamine 2-epimerase
MKILFLSGSRGEWGYVQPVIDLCRQRGVDYGICATNMLLLPQYGKLIDALKTQGYNITDEIAMSLEGSTRVTMAKSLALFFVSFVDVLTRHAPTWLVLAGDRGEQLMGAIAAGYTYTPLAHIQAGELSGNIDGVARHAMGKFAHLHFAAHAEAAQRLRRLGEEEFRIHLVGHPALDALVTGAFSSREELQEKYDLDLARPFFLIVLHPTTEDYAYVEDQTRAVLRSLAAFPHTKLWIFPNNDAGSMRLRERIVHERTAETLVFTNLPRPDYLGFVKLAACLVGNSSSALLEAPTFRTPAVNIGRRQHQRLRGETVIDCPFEERAIRVAIEQALSPLFREQIQGARNPYGDGHSAQRILTILQETPIDDRLLVKRLTF